MLHSGIKYRDRGRWLIGAIVIQDNTCKFYMEKGMLTNNYKSRQMMVHMTNSV